MPKAYYVPWRKLQQEKGARTRAYLSIYFNYDTIYKHIVIPCEILHSIFYAT